MKVNKDEILRSLGRSGEGVRILVCDSLPSTNDALCRLARSGEAQGQVIIARSQSAGRGRSGKSFQSPEGGLYMSVLLRRRLDFEQARLLTPTAAAAVCLALERQGIKTQVKWVNDLLRDGKKVCGILTECEFTPEGLMDWAVVGIGINLLPVSFRDGLEKTAGCVLSRGESLDVNRLVAHILEGLLSPEDSAERAALLSLYRSRSCMTGRQIAFIRDGSAMEGTVLGLDESCALLVDVQGSVLRLEAGEAELTGQL